MFWPSAKEGHFPPIPACTIIPRQQKLWCWKEKREGKLIWHDKLGCLGLAAKHTPHFSFLRLCNWTAGGPDKFPYGSLAPTSKCGHSLHGECWQILTFLSVLKLETFLENNYLPFIILGRWAWEEWLPICTEQCIRCSENIWLIPDYVKQRPGPTAPRWTQNGVSFLQSQLWEEIKLQVNSRDTGVHSAWTNSERNDGILQTQLKTKQKTPVIPRVKRRKIAATKGKHSKK